MYERKIKEDLNCGVTVAMKVLGGKWKACIIDAVSKGFHRPSEIHRYVPEATPRVLDIQLGELLEVGAVWKKTGEGFPLYSEYFLTPLGASLLPIIQQLEHWGDAHKHEVKDRLSLEAV